MSNTFNPNAVNRPAKTEPAEPLPIIITLYLGEVPAATIHIWKYRKFYAFQVHSISFPKNILTLGC